MKDLVAYFSAGGRTAKTAQTLAEAIGAELYEIKPAVPYTQKDLNYMNEKSRTTIEMQDKNCRPELADKDAPVAEAERIFIGFPVWWYREPSIIDSFLEAYDFSGKKVIPFCTSGMSPLGEGQERIAELAKGAEVLPGRRFTPRTGGSEMKAWAESL